MKLGRCHCYLASGERLMCILSSHLGLSVEVFCCSEVVLVFMVRRMVLDACGCVDDQTLPLL